MEMDVLRQLCMGFGTALIVGKTLKVMEIMPTNDEHREVARRIRDKGSISYYSDVFKLIMGHEPPLGTSAREDDEALAERLADLIEPEPERTCHMIDNGCELCCSECDWRHSYDDDPNYCMGCGAKVVDE